MEERKERKGIKLLTPLHLLILGSCRELVGVQHVANEICELYGCHISQIYTAIRHLAGGGDLIHDKAAISITSQGLRRFEFSINKYLEFLEHLNASSRN